MDQPMNRTAATRPVVYDGSKSPQAIEEDIARTRVRLSATIEALKRELDPQQMLETSTKLLRSSLEPAPGSFRTQTWAYAIPLALIATGLGWLFLLRRRSYQPEMPACFGEMPAEEVEMGETPTPAPSSADLAGSVEPVPVSPVDEAATV
ncbi:MAG TPA: DUF3618 domain-containing protein [Stellaceae bacterium]|jgi:hypothetical protein|nr:DUF3618 domain-containing protein [Stellaceae bacterium]